MLLNVFFQKVFFVIFRPIRPVNSTANNYTIRGYLFEEISEIPPPLTRVKLGLYFIL